MSGSILSTYTCRRCKENFSTKREQMLHRKEKHDGNPNDNSFSCKLCGKYFANHGNLERHMKVHNDVRPHVCLVCNKSFAQAVNLQRHYSVHNGDRPFQCQVCEKTFTQQGNLRRHELIHTGEKPFRCKRCNRSFSQRINLKKHVMAHQGYKPYVCGICQKSFIQSQNYKKHLKNHTNVLPSQETADVNAAHVKMEQFAYECAVCRLVFEHFANFESHEVFCGGIGTEKRIENTNAHINNVDQTVASQSNRYLTQNKEQCC